MSQEIEYILTHPGGAHKDDFLACCLLAYRHQTKIVRRDPTAEELDDPGVAVVDVGHRHEPDRNNFDHHQFAADHPPVCALSLVLQDMGLYDDARRFCDWLEPAEYLDTRGPIETTAWLGVARDILAKTLSPIDITLLRRFAKQTEIDPGSAIWQVMSMVGEDLVTYLQDLRARLDYIGEHSEFWEFHQGGDEPFEVLFMPRTDPLPEEASSGLGRFIEESGKQGQVVAMIYPDRRGSGYGLSRFEDSPRVNFSSLESTCEDVHFAHKRGFVCKTSSTDRSRLRDLIKIAADNAADQS